MTTSGPSAASRPRDRLGRPLADVDPSAPAVPPVPDLTGAADDTVWATAVDLIDAGLPFHAHEVLEQRWRSADPADRTAWRALAQWAAALTHAARGNAVGAGRLAERALATLADAPAVPPCVDVDVVRGSCVAIGSAVAHSRM